MRDNVLKGYIFLNFKIVELSTLAGLSIFSIILNFTLKYSGSLGGLIITVNKIVVGSNPFKVSFFQMGAL